MLAYIRTQEEQADRAGVKFLTATGQSPKGMYDTFKRLSDELLYQAHYIDLQTHPMPKERVAALELVKTSPYWDKKDSPELQARHDMMRAKLYGFMDRAGTARPLSGERPEPAGALCPSRPRAFPIRAPPWRRSTLIETQPQNPISTSSRVRRSSKAASPPRRSLRRAIARPQPGPDPGHARAGARRKQRSGATG